MRIEPGECLKCGAELPIADVDEYDERIGTCDECGAVHIIEVHIEIDLRLEEE